MEQKPMICVSSDSINRVNSPLRWIACPKTYPQAITAAGGIPLLSCESNAAEMAVLCDGLLLTGGSDLSPRFYGEELLNDTVKVNEDRDLFEVDLARAFLAAKKPILAICRGFQLVNVLLGGTLYQDLAEQLGLQHFDPQLRHPVHAERGSILAHLYGQDFFVNSTHHQAVRTLGTGLTATAFSPEGLVEAYEDADGLILGTQFHPERLTGPYRDERTPDMAPYFAHFVRLAGKYRQTGASQ